MDDRRYMKRFLETRTSQETLRLTTLFDVQAAPSHARATNATLAPGSNVSPLSVAARQEHTTYLRMVPLLYADCTIRSGRRAVRPGSDDDA